MRAVRAENRIHGSDQQSCSGADRTFPRAHLTPPSTDQPVLGLVKVRSLDRGLLTGGIWQLPGSTDRHDRPIRSIQALREPHSHGRGW
jgi:hypothetical protein